MTDQVLDRAAQTGADRARTDHVLELLAATNPEAEIWWDSSPLVYDSWKAETLAKDPDSKTSGWSEQLGRLLDAQTILAEGKMGFRGVTTNPPLCLQAIKLAPDVWADRIKAIAQEHPEALNTGWIISAPLRTSSR